MKKSEVLFGILRIPLDALAVMAALLLSYRLREANIDLIPRVQLLEPATTLPSVDVYFSTFAIPGMLLFIIIAGLLHLYALRTTRSAWNEAGNILIASALWIVGVIGWYFLVRKQLFYSRVLLLHATFFITVFVLLARATVVLLQRSFLRAGVGVRHVVSLGTQSIAPGARETLERDIRYHYLGHLPDLASLTALTKEHALDLVMQTDPNPVGEETIALINYCRSQHIGYAFLPPVFADVPHQLAVERLGLFPMMRFQPTPLDGWGRVWKRAFDCIASIVLLLLLSPIFLFIALLIIIDSGWPIFYVSWRVGERAGRRIPVLKFRSMVPDADLRKEQLLTENERNDGPLFKLQNDPRITGVGRILRRFDLDELPQLLNVALGQMSLVGPRPHLPAEVSLYSPQQRRVFAVKPGITGLAQISGRSGLRFEEEVRLDIQYIEEWSFALDLWILWRTIFVVWMRERT
jgi:exopolysaccharide biosynthesis polyprenyl glycosylphosphotransferase